MKIIIKAKSGDIIKEFPADVNKTILSQLREQEVEVASACQHWICGACMMHIESGLDSVIKNKKTEAWFPLAENELMTCIWWIKEWATEDIVLVSIN